MGKLDDIPSASSTATVAAPSDPLGDIPKADTSLSDAHNEAINHNPDHVAKALDLSKRGNIDPNYALGNLPAVEKAATAPDLNIKTRNPALYALLNSAPHVMGIGSDDIHAGGSLALLENNVKSAKIASSMLEVAKAGWQDSVRGRELASGPPNIVLGPNADATQRAVAGGISMALDLPEFVSFGAMGSILGPTAASMAAFGGHAALKQALEERDHGSIESASELIRRAKAVALPATKGAATGLALAVTGGAAAAYGASPAAKLAFEVGAMTTTGPAMEGRMPELKDAIDNSILFLGAHAASMSWAKMGEIAEGSKIRGRGDVGAQTFADHADTVSGPAYVPVEKWDALHGADVEAMNKKLGIEKAYEAAKASGGDVEIPAGKFLSADMDPHRDKLADDIKSDPEAQTINQLKDAEAERKKQADLTKEGTPATISNREQGTGTEGRGEETLSPRERYAAGRVREGSDEPLQYDSGGSGAVDEGLRRLGVKQTFAPSAELKAKLDEAGLPAITLHEFDQTPENASKFSSAITASKNASKFGASVYVYPEAEYQGMRTFTSEDGKSGFAIKPDGDIVSVFSDGGGKVHSMLELAVQQGGKKLDCFDTMLPIIYKANGFKEVRHEPWNEEYAPPGWDKKTFAKFNNGEPDIVYMEYDPKHVPEGISKPAPAAEKPTLPYTQYPGLSNKQRTAETSFASLLSKPDAVEKYAALPKTEGGKVLDVDELRALSPDYSQSNASRMAHTLSTHKPASAWIRQEYARKLAEQPAKGQVLFMAGGGGSGKSTVRNGILAETSKKAEIVMDGTLSKESIARDQIEAALASGRDVKIVYVHRPFESAVEGIVARAKMEQGGGRWVPSATLANDHVMAQETFKLLAEHYRGDPRVELIAFDNPDSRPESKVIPREISLDRLHELSYTQEGENPSSAIERLTEVARKHNGELEREAEEAGRDQPGGNAQAGSGAERGDTAGDGEGNLHPRPAGVGEAAALTPLQQREQATSEAVAAAQQETGQAQRPIPGVDPRMQAELDKARESARKEAEKILLKPQLEELKRENRSLLNAERKRALDEVKNQVANEPVFKAFALFNPEGTEAGISQKSIWKKSVDYMNNRLNEEDSMHFEAIAEMSGFTSADEMARKLLVTERGPSFNMQVRARLEQHMGQFAHLKDTDAMREEALRAVHTDASGQLIALQAQVMEGMAQNAEINADTARRAREYKNEMWEASKRMARDTINAKPNESAGRFRAYYTAERDAAVRAEKAEAKKKWQEAGAARLEQMHSHALAAESLRARDNIARWSASIEKQRKADPLTWKDQDHFFQAAAIMNRFGFERRDYEPSKRAESLQSWAARMEEKTNTVEIPAWLQDESISKDWRKLTPPELQDVRNALKNIKHVANFEDTAYTVFDKADLGVVAKELVETQMANAHNKKSAPLSLHQDWRDKIVASKDAAMFQLIAPETWLRKLDGYKNFGSWQRAFYEQYARGADEKAKMLVEAAEGYSRIWDAYTPKEREAMSKKVFVPELGDSLMKSEIMTMALNYGSESNKQRLFEGRNWEDIQVKSILDREMSKRDWDTIQATWDQINTLWPKIAELYTDLTGFTPDKIEAQKFMTPHGEYAGGYFPLRSDPRVEVRGALDQDVAASLADSPPAWRASTKNGFTKGRVEGAQYKVSLDINGIQRHMTDVIHDLTMRKWVLDANRLLARKDVQASISDAIGMDGYRMMNDWVKSVAGTNDFQSREFMGDFFHGLRRRTIIANLGLRISSTILQADDLSAYGSVDPDNFGVMSVAKAVTGFYGEVAMSPSKFHEGTEFVYSRSKYMKYERGENIDRDIKDAARREWGSDDTMAKASMAMVSTADKLLSIPVWKEAYSKGLELHEGNEQKATDYADLIIRRAQATGRIGELSAIMRGSEKQKALTMFYSFMNRRLNLWYEAIDRTKDASDIPRLAGTAMALWVVPTMFSSLIHNGLPDNKMKQKKYMKDMLLYPTSLFPVIRDVADFAMDKAMGLPSFGYSPTPMTRSVETLGNMIGTLAKGKAKTESKVESVAKVASYAVPYPDQINAWIFNMADYINHGMTPRAGDIMKRRPKKER